MRVAKRSFGWPACDDGARDSPNHVPPAVRSNPESVRPLCCGVTASIEDAEGKSCQWAEVVGRLRNSSRLAAKILLSLLTSYRSGTKARGRKENKQRVRGEVVAIEYNTHPRKLWREKVDVCCEMVERKRVLSEGKKEAVCPRCGRTKPNKLDWNDRFARRKVASFEIK